VIDNHAGSDRTAAFDELYRRWVAAVADRQRDELSALFHERYTYTAPDGTRLGRAEILDAEMNVPVPEYPFHRLEVDVFGDVAVARGEHLLRGEITSDSFEPELVALVAAGVQIAFTTVWLKSGDTWLVISNDSHLRS